MLSSIRNMMGSIFMLAIIGLLIASFALWGIPDIFSSGAGRAVAEVENTQITGVEFARTYDQRFRRAQAQMGDSFTRERARQMGLPRQVLQQVVSRTVFELHADALGLRASDSYVIDELHAIPAFEGFSGGFDRRTYEQQLQRIGMSPAEFEDQLRSDIVRRQFFEALTAANPVPDELARTLFRYRQEERKATVVTLNTSLVGSVEPPSEDELRQAYESDKQQYMTPEYREVAVARISPDSLAKPEEVTQAELEQAYQERIREYRQPERRTVALATFERDETERAERFAQRVKGGKAFDQVLRDMTDFTPEEADLGEVTQEDIESDYNKKVARAVFNVAGEGAVTEPVQSVFGWHIFHIEGVTPPEETPLEEVAEELRQEVAREKAQDRVYDLSVEVEDALASGAGVQEIAREFDLAYARARVTEEGRTPEGELASQNLRDQLEALWSVQVEEPPILEPTENNGFAILDALEVIEPEQKSFEAVKDQLRQRLLRERRMNEAGKLAERAAERIRAGEDPQAVADSMGASVFETDWVSRNPDRQNRSLAPSIQRTVFDLEKGKVGIERAANERGYVVLRVEQVRPGDPEAKPEAFAQLKRQLQQRLVNDALTQYENALRASMGVTLNSDRLEQVVSGGAGGPTRRRQTQF